YNEPTTDNTETKVLVRQSDGEVQLRDASTLGMGGSGQANRIAYFSGSNTLTFDNDFQWDGSFFMAHPAMWISMFSADITLEVTDSIQILSDSFITIDADTHLGINAPNIVFGPLV